MDSVDAVVVGAGVVGLAIARALALAGREVWVLEAEDRFGSQTSSRSSEVIHAGLYYPEGSLKARLCVEGRERLYRYCASRGVPHRRLGKLLVAADASELPRLERIGRSARAAGVPLEPLGAADVARLEPQVRAVAGLWSASTGIVDSHALMLALLGDAERAGATLVLRAPLARARALGGGFELEVGGNAPLALRCALLVNAAGLAATRVASSIEGLDARQVPPAHFAKGHYFTLAGRSPFAHLVYPMPDDAGLGIHATLDLAGRCRFGPDVTRWLDAPDYAFEEDLAPRFERAIRRWWPALPDGALQPGYVGVRPKIAGPGEPAADFAIRGPASHGLDGLVNLFGIESPGLTASLAIAAEVCGRLGLPACGEDG